jgi:hypothetical protein
MATKVAGMNGSRTVTWILGAALLIAGAFMLYFNLGLNRWVSIGVLAAGLLILLGLAAMGFAGGARTDHHDSVVTERVVDDRHHRGHH